MTPTPRTLIRVSPTLLPESDDPLCRSHGNLVPRMCRRLIALGAVRRYHDMRFPTGPACVDHNSSASKGSVRSAGTSRGTRLDHSTFMFLVTDRSSWFTGWIPAFAGMTGCCGPLQRITACAMRAKGTIHSSCRLMQNLPGCFQVRGIKSLGEPAVYSREHLLSFYRLSVLLPKTTQAHCRAQLERLRVLPAGNLESLPEAGFHLGVIVGKHFRQQFSLEPVQFRLAETVLGPVNPLEGLVYHGKPIFQLVFLFGRTRPVEQETSVVLSPLA